MLCPSSARTVDIQKNNFGVLSVGDILYYYLLPAALRNGFSENLYTTLSIQKPLFSISNLTILYYLSRAETINPNGNSP